MPKIKRTNQVIYSSDDPRDNKSRAYSSDINWERSNTEFLYSMKLIAEGNGTNKGGSSLDSELIKEILDRLQNGGNNNTTPLQDLSQYAIQETSNVSGLVNEPQIVKFTGDFSLIKILYTINGETAQQYTSDGIIINEPGFYRLAVYSLPIDETDITKYKDSIKKDITYNPSIEYNPSVEYDAESDKIIVNININNLNLYNINELKFKYIISNTLDISETNLKTIDIDSSMVVDNSNIKIEISETRDLNIYDNNNFVILASFLLYYDNECSSLNKTTIKNENESNTEDKIQSVEYDINFSWSPNVEDALNDFNNYNIYVPGEHNVYDIVGYYGLTENLQNNDNIPDIQFRLSLTQDIQSESVNNISIKNRELRILWSNDNESDLLKYYQIGQITLNAEYSDHYIYPDITNSNIDYVEYTIPKNEWNWLKNNTLKIIIVNKLNEVIFKYVFDLTTIEGFDVSLNTLYGKYLIDDFQSIEYSLVPTPLSIAAYMVDPLKYYHNKECNKWYAAPDMKFEFNKWSIIQNVVDEIENNSNNQQNSPGLHSAPRLMGANDISNNDNGGLPEEDDSSEHIYYNNMGGGTVTFVDAINNWISAFSQISMNIWHNSLTHNYISEFASNYYPNGENGSWGHSSMEAYINNPVVQETFNNYLNGNNKDDFLNFIGGSVYTPENTTFKIPANFIAITDSNTNSIYLQKMYSYVIAKDANGNILNNDDGTINPEVTQKIATIEEYYEWDDFIQLTSNGHSLLNYLINSPNTSGEPTKINNIINFDELRNSMSDAEAQQKWDNTLSKIVTNFSSDDSAINTIYQAHISLAEVIYLSNEMVMREIEDPTPIDPSSVDLSNISVMTPKFKEVIMPHKPYFILTENHPQYNRLFEYYNDHVLEMINSTLNNNHTDEIEELRGHGWTDNEINSWLMSNDMCEIQAEIVTFMNIQKYFIEHPNECGPEYFSLWENEEHGQDGDAHELWSSIFDKLLNSSSESHDSSEPGENMFKTNFWPAFNFIVNNSRYTPLLTGWASYPLRTNEKWVDRNIFDENYNTEYEDTVYTYYNDDAYYHIIYYNEYNTSNLTPSIINTNLKKRAKILFEDNEMPSISSIKMNPYSPNIFALTNERLNKNSVAPYEIFKDSIIKYEVNIVPPKFFPIIMYNIDEFMTYDLNQNYTGCSHIITNENNEADGIYINSRFEGYYRPNRKTGIFEDNDIFPDIYNISNYILYDTEFLDDNEVIVIPYSTDKITIFTGSVPYIDKEWRITFKKKYDNGYDVIYTDDYQTKVKYISYPICKSADKEMPYSALEGGGLSISTISDDDYVLVSYKRDKIKLYGYNLDTFKYEPKKETAKLGEFKMYTLEGGHVTTLEMYIQHFCEQYQNPNMDYDLLDNWTKYKDIKILMGCAKNNQGYGEEVFEYVYKTYENFWNFANNHYDLEETEEGYYHVSATSMSWLPDTNSYMTDIDVSYDHTQRHRVYAQKMTLEELDNIYFIPISLDENKVPLYFNETHNVHIPTYKKTIITGKRKVGTEYENITTDVYKMIGIHVNEQNIKYWRAGNYNDHINPDGLHRMEAIIDFNDADTNNYYDLLMYLSSVNNITRANVTKVNSITLDNNSPTNSGTVINCNAINSVYDNFNENVIVKYNNCNFRVSGDLKDINTINIIDDNNIEMNNLVSGNFGVLTNENMANYRYYFEEPTIVNGIEEEMITWKSAENLFNFYENLSKSKILLSDEFINSINNITKGVNTFVKSNVISQEKGNLINARVTQIKQNFEDFKESIKYIDEYAEHGDPVDLDPVDLTNH